MSPFTLPWCKNGETFIAQHRKCKFWWNYVDDTTIFIQYSTPIWKWVLQAHQADQCAIQVQSYIYSGWLYNSIIEMCSKFTNFNFTELYLKNVQFGAIFIKLVYSKVDHPLYRTVASIGIFLILNPFFCPLATCRCLYKRDT